MTTTQNTQITSTRTPMDFTMDHAGERIHVTGQHLTERGALLAGTVLASDNAHRVGLTVWFRAPQ